MLHLTILGDVHYSTAGPQESSILFHRSAEILQTALEQIARRPHPPDLVIQMGDLGDGTDETPPQAVADLDAAIALLDRSGLRWTWIPGNHDYVVCGPRALVPRLRRARLYGELVLGNNVFLLLNSACAEMQGRIDAGQQAWLEQSLDLYRRRHVFVFVHHVFDSVHDYGMYIENGEAIRALLLGSRAVKAVFMAHAHTPRITTVGGLHEIVAGCLSSWPLMFRHVEILPDRLRVWSEKVAVAPELETEALMAHRAYPKPWDDRIRQGDLEAELPLR